VNQSYKEFEVLVIQDGRGPMWSVQIEDVLRQTDLKASVTRLDKSETWGNRSRWYGTQIARGSHVVYFGSDNVIFPNYLANHAANIEENPHCISLVNIDYWQGIRHLGKVPTGLAVGQCDLLCYALPTDVARECQVFGSEVETVREADGLALEACTRQLRQVLWDREQEVCGIHF
jgi:hypothetical protein